MPLPEIVTRKFGPLPGWAWGGLGLGVALAVASWNRNKADSAADEAAVTESYDLPANLQPTYVFQNYDQDVSYGDVINVPGVPPTGGRPPTPPPPPGGGTTPPPPPPPPPPAPPKPVPKPVPKPAPKPPPAPKGQWVTVVPWKKGRRAGTPDSLWGIAEKVFGLGKASGTLVSRIWGAPQNASLRSKRKKPDLIRAGDRVWVPQ